MPSVEILEVAPRDGFQSVKPFIPTDTKIALVEGLAECGFKRLEIGSFVSPKAIAQMADTLNVKQSDVIEMEQRLQGRDLSIDPAPEDGEDAVSPIAYLADTAEGPAFTLRACVLSFRTHADRVDALVADAAEALGEPQNATR